MILLVFGGFKGSLGAFVQLLLIFELPVASLIDAADEVRLALAPQLIFMLGFF